MNNLLIRLRDSLGLELVEQEHVSVLCIRKPDGLAFHVTVPHDVPEWYVDAQDETGEIWADWADYDAVNGKTPEQLASDMAADIERIATILAATQARVCMHNQTKSVELKLAGAWQAASRIWGEPDPAD